MAVAHGETRRRAPALTIGARVVPMIDAARAAEHADLMPVTKSPTEPGGRLASYVALHRVGHKREVGIAAFFNHLRTSQEIDGLLGIADENILKDASFLRRDPSALQ